MTDQKRPNVHPETGVAYGVMPMLKLHDCVHEEILNRGTDLSLLRLREEALKVRGIKTFADAMRNPFLFFNIVTLGYEEINDTIMPVSVEGEDCEYELKLDNVEGMMFPVGGALHFMVTRSDYVGQFRLCSPCFPNAGDLSSPDAGGFDAYDVPPEWKI